MNHSFSIEVAQKYGIEEAILLEHLFWWCEKNRANGKHLIEGRYWTYNSAKAFAELFPYMSPAKIRRTLISMEDSGLIVSGNFNDNKYDQTKWYALTELATAFYRNVKSSEQNCKMNITDINTDINTEKKEKKQTYDTILDEEKVVGKKREAVTEFIKMRKVIRKPLTDHALKLMLRELEKLSDQESEQIAILEQSIANSWQGVFPLRKNGNEPAQHKDYSDIKKEDLEKEWDWEV